MIVGASSGKYDVTSISNALRQAYRNNSKPATMATQSQDVAELVCSFCKKKGHIKKNCFKRIRQEKESSPEKGTKRCILHLSHVKYGPFMPCYSGFRCLHICCGKRYS